MKIGAPRFFQRSVLLAAACILAVVLTACTGKGGGYLPPQKPGVHRPGAVRLHVQLREGWPESAKIELAYNDKGAATRSVRRLEFTASSTRLTRCWNPQFALARIHRPGRNQPIFLGRYSQTSSAPAVFPSTCPERNETTSLCRFEVIVQDNDNNLPHRRGTSSRSSYRARRRTSLNSQWDRCYARAGLPSGRKHHRQITANAHNHGDRKRYGFSRSRCSAWLVLPSPRAESS